VTDKHLETVVRYIRKIAQPERLDDFSERCGRFQTWDSLWDVIPHAVRK
jgi:hypothetical protein